MGARGVGAGKELAKRGELRRSAAEQDVEAASYGGGRGGGVALVSNHVTVEADHATERRDQGGAAGSVGDARVGGEHTVVNTEGETALSWDPIWRNGGAGDEVEDGALEHREVADAMRWVGGFGALGRWAVFFNFFSWNLAFFGVLNSRVGVTTPVHTQVQLKLLDVVHFQMPQLVLVVRSGRLLGVGEVAAVTGLGCVGTGAGRGGWGLVYGNVSGADERSVCKAMAAVRGI